MQLWIGSKRFVLFILGLFFFSLGVVLMIEAGLGVSPWDVFHIGLEKHIPLTLGQTVQAVGLCLILLSWLQGFKPDLGTIISMILVGFFIDAIFYVGIINSPFNIFFQVVYFVVGLTVFALGSGMYINASWGAGPRDSLMLAINKKYGFGIIKVRTAIELTALAVGFLLGGPVGLGTVAFSLTVGMMVKFFLNFTKRFYLSAELSTEKSKPA